MKCKKCGKKNNRLSKSCSNCGAKIEERVDYKKWMIIPLIVIGMIFILQKTIYSIKEYVDVKTLALSEEINKKNDDNKSESNNNDKSQLNNQEELSVVEEYNNEENSSVVEEEHNIAKEYSDEEYNSEEEYNDEEINTQIIDLVEQLQFNYDIAINTGDVSKTYPYITKTGNLYSSYNKNIPLWHNEGMRTVTEEVEYTDVELNDDGTYKIGRYSICKVSRNNVVVYEKEYIEFIIIEENGRFIVDSCKNYEMIDNNYYY